jgi:prephenate dehydrogenase
MISPAESSPGAQERRAVVVGVGLIGGSIALGLRAAGWMVQGVDLDAAALAMALSRGAIDAEGHDSRADLVVVAVPSASTVSVLRELLSRYDSQSVLFTDVAGVKSSICSAIDDPRFIGGHPMAGSEQFGIEGARADLFLGASWVLTPRSSTPAEQYRLLLEMLRDLGAQGIALTPEDHDRLVALVSHVPHLVAVSLMNEASEAAKDDAALLLLAAGGFRDMTRIAAGDPAIWPDLCLENRVAIVRGLDDLVARICLLREAIEEGEREQVEDSLRSASRSRNALPGRSAANRELSQIRVPVPDRPGVLAEVTSAAGELGVSVYDVEIAHSIEGDRGVLILLVGSSEAERYVANLGARGFSCSVTEL